MDSVSQAYISDRLYSSGTWIKVSDPIITCHVKELSDASPVSVIVCLLIRFGFDITITPPKRDFLVDMNAVDISFSLIYEFGIIAK